MGDKVTILLAEDHPVNRDVASYLIQRMGYAVDTVANGFEVLDAVRARRYSLVLMDLRMPEMDGVETTRRIMDEIPADRRPYVVAMTADVTRERQRQCREVGMSAFISKPIEKERLREVLYEYVGRIPTGDGAPSL